MRDQRPIVCSCHVCSHIRSKTVAKPADILQKLRHGDQITNDELVTLKRFLEPFERAYELGDIAMLFAVQVGHWIDKLRDYESVRSMNGNISPCFRFRNGGSD